MEHLHPDDAHAQLRDIARALGPGGRYVCVTPNRLTGPHDISAAFSATPRGFHLREYTTHDLRELMRAAGFARVQLLVTVRGWTLLLPAAPIAAVERALLRLPRRAARAIVRAVRLHKVLDTVVATTPR